MPSPTGRACWSRRSARRDLLARQQAVEAVTEEVLRDSVSWLALGLVLLWLGVITVRRRILRPLSALETGLARVSDGDLHTQVRVEGSDEIGRLGDAFQRHDAGAARPRRGAGTLHRGRPAVGGRRARGRQSPDGDRRSGGEPPRRFRRASRPAGRDAADPPAGATGDQAAAGPAPVCPSHPAAGEHTQPERRGARRTRRRRLPLRGGRNHGRQPARSGFAARPR